MRMEQAARSTGDSGLPPELTIVIPAHNEQNRIRPTLESYLSYFGGRAELMVVLNGCTDGTLSVVTAVERKCPELRVLDFPRPIGKGGAVKEGFLHARGQTVGFVDADGATTPEEFQRLVSALQTADGVIASRWMRGAQVFNRTSWLRRLASRSLVLMTYLLFRLPYADTQCGAKVFRRPVIKTIASSLQLRTMAFDVELLLRARAAGFKVIEVPTIWTDHHTVLNRPWRFFSTSFGVLSSLLGLRRMAKREHLL